MIRFGCPVKRAHLLGEHVHVPRKWAKELMVGDCTMESDMTLLPHFDVCMASYRIIVSKENYINIDSILLDFENLVMLAVVWVLIVHVDCTVCPTR